LGNEEWRIGMAKKEEVYLRALEGKRIPILTLDHKWHHLFQMMEPDKELNRLEEELNNLLKRQGKLNTESKNIKKIKKKLMDEIVQAMEKDDLASQKKTEDNKRLIEECNEKLDEYQDELLDLPKQIDKANRELMLRTMEMCYEVLQVNTRDITEIGEWIEQVRVELKKNIIRKQEKEIKNNELYTFMHNIFGADVINIFDMKYNPSENVPKKKEESK